MPHDNSSAGPSKVLPASLSHFVIFNPTIKPDIPRTDNKDEDDDIKEAAQILFYTSREAGGVSRDKMLRQVGLAKGLMGFANMLIDSSDKYTSIHGNRSRMIVYTPEPDFFIYVCITLSHLDNERSDPISGSQGTSDEMLVDGLARGYEDFRLLHGPLSSHETPSKSTSNTLDKYFTRFAFQFESTHLSSPSISDWIGSYPSCSRPKSIFSEYEFSIEGSLLLVSPEGPLHHDDQLDDPSLLRFLHNLVKATIPPPAIPPILVKEDRQSLGFGLNLGLGRKSQAARKGSWTTLGGWVPKLRRPSTPSRPSTPTVAAKAEEGVKRPEDESKAKWGLGLGGIGDAVGNVGTVFGLGKSTSATIAKGTDVETVPSTATKSDVSAHDQAKSLEQPSGESTPHHVEQSKIAVAELEAAVKPDEDLEWESRNLWIRADGGGDVYEKRRVSWITRDNILIAIISPQDAFAPYNLPSSKATLELFKRLVIDISSEAKMTGANSCIAVIGKDRVTQGEFDTIADQSLIQLRSTLCSPPIHELFAKSTSSRFLVAKKHDRQEMYMQVGADDASLTDADYAVRSFLRAHAPAGAA
uniref:CCZ1/INTU/HSP4 first Longin domain-containing protein n=1 Tax=Kwoniella dejecticola CBS 10117 TaxID=1296121 RepID=A0A1A6A570_9TREE|nr:uncharacterized protein I303_04542 [Kwoniella dejecticola CBS 10117]OBR85210.1 hypothetical protein I303_04542 [Kwoniella dejecticola CBS 10117]